MAYDIYLADRMHQVLKSKGVKFVEKKMMGGLTFMVDDKMCVGIIKNDMMIRVDPNSTEDLIKKEGCRLMDFTGRPMKGFLMIEPIAYDLDDDLSYWIQLALDYNPLAISSKKK